MWVITVAFLVIGICFGFPLNAAMYSSIRSVSASYGGNLLGRAYETNVRGTNLLAAPLWLPDAANPPLSVRAAEEAATNGLAKVVGDIKGWKRGEIVLDEWSQDRWVYRFSFSGPSIQLTNEVDRVTNFFRLTNITSTATNVIKNPIPTTSWRFSSLVIIVLMNGEAVLPEPKAELPKR